MLPSPGDLSQIADFQSLDSRKADKFISLPRLPREVIHSQWILNTSDNYVYVGVEDKWIKIPTVEEFVALQEMVRVIRSETNVLSNDVKNIATFDWLDEQGISVLRSHEIMRQTIRWRQGTPQIANFSIDNIEIVFYRDRAATDEILESDDDYSIGDEVLDEIITLDSFVDNENGTGTVDIVVDPEGIDIQELMMERDVYIVLRSMQPSLEAATFSSN